MKKCAEIQIFKIKHFRIENLGQKWRMRFFIAKNQLLFEIKLLLPEAFLSLLLIVLQIEGCVHLVTPCVAKFEF